MTQEEKALVVINSLAAAQMLHECLDDLEGTPYYRHSLKVTTKKVQEELTKTMDNHIAHLWGIDEETMRMIQEGIQEVAKELATMDPARIAKLGDMLKNNELIFEE